MKLPPRVSCGGDHILLLMGDGTLYGMGTDDTGQLNGVGAPEPGHARKLAEGVADAAAGDNNSLLCMQDGTVRIFGRGQYAERFTGFGGEKDGPRAVRVYAEQSDADQFWILDNRDQLWCFGDNSREDLKPFYRTLLYTYPKEVYDSCLSDRVAEVSAGGSSSIYVFPVDDDQDKRRAIMHRLVEEPVYKKLIDDYGEANLEMKLSPIHSEFKGSSSSYYSHSYYGRDVSKTLHFSFYRKKVQPVVYLTNMSIFKPVPCDREQVLSDDDNSGREKRRLLGDQPESFLCKQRYYSRIHGHGDFSFYLDEQDRLWMEIDRSRDEPERHLLAENVFNVSISRSLIAFSLKSGEAYAGHLSDLKEMEPPEEVLRPVFFDEA